nr:MAG TPA: hypothetical protein [Caudoviricetes sp.]
MFFNSQPESHLLFLGIFMRCVCHGTLNASEARLSVIRRVKRERSSLISVRVNAGYARL